MIEESESLTERLGKPEEQLEGFRGEAFLQRGDAFVIEVQAIPLSARTGRSILLEKGAPGLRPALEAGSS